MWRIICSSQSVGGERVKNTHLNQDSPVPLVWAHTDSAVHLTSNVLNLKKSSLSGQRVGQPYSNPAGSGGL